MRGQEQFFHDTVYNVSTATAFASRAVWEGSLAVIIALWLRRHWRLGLTQDAAGFPSTIPAAAQDRLDSSNL